ncbi:MAG: tRNA (N(6)-L-threonylcarbamoyladenosine(37)-C(2))-methylthiotransferase MtaB [Nitrospiraceae bacterium]|nr:tRNA (N(6)-L-threonylcarbamoyladenosine(37)-C(2))-methylthiotransferase MtaB [Nitrospiraceae bacterium]MSR23690.1 tRNA (N(6)-L-threonylcarbamoyladenosine(37)-C(2))-methylthiotransferase MtaB [Nitrospiraceae bacterium]
MMTGRPRASLHTLGCRLNQAETALLADRLQQDGYQIVDYGRPTDLLVLNTCSVTDEAERMCRYEIRRTLRHSPQAFVAVTGCYAQTGVEALQQVPGIDLIVGNRHKMSLPAHVPSPSALRKRPAPSLLHTKTLDRDDFVLDGAGDCDSKRANLKIQDGCNFMCSFCLIPFARGHERSRRIDDTIREAEALVARGHRELVLTGVNIGRYTQGGSSLLDLIQRLEHIAGLERIRISSIEPTTVPDDLLEYMAASTKLCRHLHLPLQSGDDGILRAMNRRYTVRDYAVFVEQAMRTVPGLGLGTDVLVGFPGEGDAQFANTLTAATDLPFSYLHVFSYSKRPGTAAVRMADAVPPATVKARSRTLAELSRARRMAFYQRYVGSTVDVLFETKDDAGRWTGLTGNYMRVGVTSGNDLANSLRRVAIEGIMDGLAVGEVLP